MIGAVRAALLLGGSSIVAIVTTLATAKGLALLVGPHGVGAYALLQSLVDLAALIAGLGVGVSLVRLIADALERDAQETVRAVRSASSVLAWSVGGGAAIAVLAFQDVIAELLFGSTGMGLAVAAAAVAIPFSLAAATNVATLSAFREVGAIAGLRSVAAAVTAVATIGAASRFGEPGIALGILATAIALWLGASLILRRRTSGAPWPSLGRIAGAARELIKFGAPYAGSALVGTGVQLAIPFVVALELSTEAAGFYRAATQISAGYLTFIAAAMLQDYYPRLSAEHRRPDELVRLIDQQLKLILILTVPLILIGIALSDLIVPLLYSAAFVPAVGILGWQLVGTLLKLPSWTLSFAILARGRTKVYFVVELVGGLTILAASIIGMRLFGLPGLGLAVLLTYAIYYPIVWLAVRRDLPLRVTPSQLALVATTAVALGTQLLPEIGLGQLRQPIALALAVVGILVAAFAFRGVLRGHPYPEASNSPEPAEAIGPAARAIDRDRLQ